MIRRAFLIFTAPIIILSYPADLFAIAGVTNPAAVSDDSVEWLNQLYQKSGHSLSVNDSEETAVETAQTSARPSGESSSVQKQSAERPTADMSKKSPNPEPEDTLSRKNPEAVDGKSWAEDTTTPLEGERVKVSGHYRIGAGSNFREFILNDSNSDLQDWNWHYVFGERLNNTYDPAIYSQYLLNVDFSPLEKTNIHTQIVADPWSYVGTTGEQVQRSDIGTEVMRYNLKYFGANNSTIAQSFRTNLGDQAGFPVMKITDGHTSQTVVHGFYDWNPPTNGVPFTIPETDIDYEFRPIRKFWVDHTEDRWHARVFALADERQALTTDDPLGLSNHKDYWQQSPWLYQYQPIQFFSDGSVQRGYYSDFLSFYAKDSGGNRLVLLKGASLEADLGKTYIASTVAAPYTPWDEKYFSSDNIPGAVRIKHQATDQLMVGGTYTFRSGLINNSVADFNQNVGVDTKYKINEHVTAKAEVAGSHREADVMTNDRLRTSTQGYAYKTEIGAKFDHKFDGHTDAALSYAQMDQSFEPSLSRYSNTRDDHVWGNHIQFKAYSPDLEYFRLGDGLDINRFVVRFNWREQLFKEKFINLFDVRNVHKTNNTAYKETVLRDETTLKISRKATVKGLFRWQGLPQSTPYIEPFLSSYQFVGLNDPSNVTLQNVAVPADANPSRFTYSGGLRYDFNPQWAAEGIYEHSNDIPDFPRGLLNGNFRDANDRVDGLLLDHLTNFLYGQGAVGGVPPYDYFNVFRERLIFRPADPLTVTFHAAQNSYKFAAGLDDNVNHQGISLAYDFTKKVSFFMDITRSQAIDLPKLIATHYAEKDYGSHGNFYSSMDYRINASTVFRAEYGVFGLGLYAPQSNPYSAVGFSLPTIDTEHIVRVSLTGDF
ncbi:MAG: hypothetical protein COT00_04610 [Candidatus Omnitrophica bacterium CG07_land_8_20_14_0_80_50_8]|nr:MAG: hypothetical protein COT00_04610 [Candidatus Omnitrophica bacterium CG07_land_8_20_14_0_80_50_8]